MIESGQNLLQYQLVEKLGEGAMGMVWKAQDTTLNREVAIKILPGSFAEDADRRSRFEREARLLASLNHPGIAGIFGLHEVQSGIGSVHFIAMEYVPGEDLAQRMKRAPLGVDDALDVARQVADALEAAHEQGVIHRDLKPANIMFTPEGQIKVLDLGLAKALSNESGSQSGSSSMSPTITSDGTMAGTLLGTPAYMSPEQVKGREADRRADIWAFGCLLYEMLTGDVTFGGETITEVMASVLRDQPKEAKLPDETPASVRHLITRCLDRDRNTRLRDIGEARIALSPEGLAFASELSFKGAGGTAAQDKKRAGLPWAVAVLAIVALGATVWFSNIRNTDATRAPEIRASIEAPDDHHFLVNGVHSGGLSLSPDGTKMTFTALSGSGRPSLFLRSLGSSIAQELPNTEGASFPFWSPDSKQVAFFADGKLKKLDLNGGAPMTITSALDGRGGTWNADGTILFAPETQMPIHRVSGGGVLGDPVTSIDTSRGGETTHRFPSFLPDGRHFLYVRGAHASNNQDAVNSIWVGDLESEETFELMHCGTQATYAQGHLFWVREQFLMARPFSVDKLEFTGDAFAVGEGVVVQLDTWRASYSVSDAGPITFQGGLAAEKILTAFDREGQEIGTIGDTGMYSEIRLSRDNRYLAAGIDDADGGQSDIWVFDIARNVGSRLTFDDGRDTKPVWSPDGKQIAFSSNRGGQSGIFVRSADGQGDAKPLVTVESQCQSQDWSRDGKYLMYDTGIGKNDIWILDIEKGESFELVSSQFDVGYGRFSPDGNWIGYISNEAGKYELYLTRFPSGVGKWQLSIDGADWLLGWNNAGTELYYLDLEGNLVSVKVELGEQAIADRPQKMYATRAGTTWDNKSDGSGFILGVPDGSEEDFPITLIINWDRGEQVN